MNTTGLRPCVCCGKETAELTDEQSNYACSNCGCMFDAARLRMADIDISTIPENTQVLAILWNGDVENEDHCIKTTAVYKRDGQLFGFGNDDTYLTPLDPGEVIGWLPLPQVFIPAVIASPPKPKQVRYFYVTKYIDRTGIPNHAYYASLADAKRFSVPPEAKPGTGCILRHSGDINVGTTTIYLWDENTCSWMSALSPKDQFSYTLKYGNGDGDTVNLIFPTKEEATRHVVPRDARRAVIIKNDNVNGVSEHCLYFGESTRGWYTTPEAAEDDIPF